MRETFVTELKTFLLDNANCSSDEMEILIEEAHKFKIDPICDDCINEVYRDELCCRNCHRSGKFGVENNE